MNTIKDKLVLACASVGGAGYMPRAPGTCGSLVGLIFFVVILRANILSELIFLALLLPFAICVAGRAEKILGRQDPQEVVIDEWVGITVTLLGAALNVGELFLGFILFRFFDIIKLYPVNFLQKNLKGGLGIVADDFVAGLQALLVLRVLIVLDWDRWLVGIF